MPWFNLIGGTLLLALGAFHLIRRHRVRARTAANPLASVVLGVGLLLSGISALLWGAGMLRVALSVAGAMCLGAAAVIQWRGYQRGMEAHLNELEAKRRGRAGLSVK